MERHRPSLHLDLVERLSALSKSGTQTESHLVSLFFFFLNHAGFNTNNNKKQTHTQKKMNTLNKVQVANKNPMAVWIAAMSVSSA